MEQRHWGRLVGVRPTKQLHKLLDRGLDYRDAFTEMNAEYGISEDKFALLWQVAEIERPVLLESSKPELFSVYVGIPFCPTRCLYCSFPSHSLKELGQLRDTFVKTLLYEIEATGRQTREHGMRLYSVYLGGGTPTALAPDDLDRILSALHNAFPGSWHELTAEAGRPDTITAEHLGVMKKHGVSRISVNPQSMNEATLERIGRCHTPGDVVRAVTMARESGINVINMDVIVGLPGEDTLSVTHTMDRVLALQPENVTVHVFSRKRASRFNENRERFPLPSAEDATEMHTRALRALASGYLPYYLYRQREILGGLENIGFTLPGFASVYNIVMIEERHQILGLGGGATSKFIRKDLSLTNIATPRDVRMYLERVNELLERRGRELKKTTDL